MDEHEKPYLIPTATRARVELLPGLSLRDLAAVAAAGAAGLLLMGLVSLLAESFVARGLALLLPPALAFLAFRQDLAGQSLAGLAQAWWRFARRPRIYVYRRGAE